MNLVELQNKIHAQNKELGWWDEPRPFSTFVCLFHSELSEAMEGDRKGLMDDHLPKYPMFQVELADFVIRCLDFLGAQKIQDYEGVNATCIPIKQTELIADLHWIISEAYSSDNDGFWTDRDEELMTAVVVSFNYAEKKDFSLLKIILEKVEYNKHRADHKRENRAKQGGKKY